MSIFARLASWKDSLFKTLHQTPDLPFSFRSLYPQRLDMALQRALWGTAGGSVCLLLLLK